MTVSPFFRISQFLGDVAPETGEPKFLVERS